MLPDQAEVGRNWRQGDIQYADLNGDGIISPGSNTLADPGGPPGDRQRHPPEVRLASPVG